MATPPPLPLKCHVLYEWPLSGFHCMHEWILPAGEIRIRIVWITVIGASKKPRQIVFSESHFQDLAAKFNRACKLSPRKVSLKLKPKTKCSSFYNFGSILYNIILYYIILYYIILYYIILYYKLSYQIQRNFLLGMEVATVLNLSLNQDWDKTETRPRQDQDKTEVRPRQDRDETKMRQRLDQDSQLVDIPLSRLSW